VADGASRPSLSRRTTAGAMSREGGLGCLPGNPSDRSLSLAGSVTYRCPPDFQIQHSADLPGGFFRFWACTQIRSAAARARILPQHYADAASPVSAGTKRWAARPAVDGMPS
jgi:hypothetical protein